MKHFINIKRISLIALMILVVIVMVGCNNNSGSNLTEITKADNTSKEAAENKISSMLKNMSLEEKIGQLLMPDFREWDGKKVTVINDEIASTIKDYHIGGIILFKENFQGRNQTKQLLQSFQTAAEIPLMFAVDQEGGLVTRIPFAPRMPGNMALGATGNTELARKVGLAIGSELNSLGIQINFGPVLDINSNPDNPVIGVRSFGDSVENVTKMGLAYMKGLNEAGVAAVGKHFPGHGDVDLDSHYVLPKSKKTLVQLRELELKPFQAAINNGIQGIMTAHIAFNQIEPGTVKSIKDGLPVEIPATLSSKIMDDLLRKEMRFEGLLFTDAMSMNAVTNHFEPVDAAIRAVNAGADIVLMPADLETVYNGLIEAVNSGKIPLKRIDESVTRILKFKAAYVFDSSNDNKIVLDAVEDFSIEKEAANLSITVVKDDGIIPLKINDNEKIAIIGFDDNNVNSLKNAVQKNYWNVKTIVLNKSLNYTGKLLDNQKEQLGDVSKIIAVISTANSKGDSWQTDTIQNIIDQGITTIVVTARNPNDAAKLKGQYAFIAQYDTGVASFDATSDVIFGKMAAKGKLPIKLRNNQ